MKKNLESKVLVLILKLPPRCSFVPIFRSLTQKLDKLFAKQVGTNPVTNPSPFDWLFIADYTFFLLPERAMEHSTSS